jgi:hypothetical protein
MWHAWRRGEIFIGGLIGRPDVKRPPGRPRRRWEDNIKMDLAIQGLMGELDSVDSG